MNAVRARIFVLSCVLGLTFQPAGRTATLSPDQLAVTTVDHGAM